MRVGKKDRFIDVRSVDGQNLMHRNWIFAIAQNVMVDMSTARNIYLRTSMCIISRIGGQVSWGQNCL